MRGRIITYRDLHVEIGRDVEGRIEIRLFDAMEEIAKIFVDDPDEVDTIGRFLEELRDALDIALSDGYASVYAEDVIYEEQRDNSPDTVPREMMEYWMAMANKRQEIIEDLGEQLLEAKGEPNVEKKVTEKLLKEEGEQDAE